MLERLTREGTPGLSYTCSNKQVPVLWTPTKPLGHLCTAATRAEASLHTTESCLHWAGDRPTPPPYRKPRSSFLLFCLREAEERLSIKVTFFWRLSCFKLTSIAHLPCVIHHTKRFMRLFAKSPQTNDLKIELTKVKARARLNWRLSSHTLHCVRQLGAAPPTPKLNQPLTPVRLMWGIASMHSVLMPQLPAGSDPAGLSLPLAPPL